MNSTNLLSHAFSSCSHDEEIKLTLQCAENIMGHFNRLIDGEGKIKYINNRNILGSLINPFDTLMREVIRT